MKRRRRLQPVAINPLVVDLSHHNEVADFDKIKAAGIAGIIHKATEAIGFVDNMYAVRRGNHKEKIDLRLDRNRPQEMIRAPQ